MKRLLAALLSVLIATGAFAADGVIQVPADSTGKKLDTSNIPAGSESSVHRQRVTVGDPSDANKLAHVNGSGELLVTCTGCSAASSVNVAHISSAIHIAGGSIAATQSGTWTATANAGSGSLTVNQGGVWATTAHQGGTWTVVVSHVSSTTHVAGTVSAAQSGTYTVGGSGTGNFVASQGTAGNAQWPVAAHQAGTWNVAHISSTVHVAGTVAISGTVPVSGTVAVSNGAIATNQSGSWTVQAAHQAGTWNTSHVSSTTHVAGTFQANRGTGLMTCHSTAVFATSANAIVIHAAGSNRIFVCGILLTVAHATSVSIVEGTGAACVTNTTAIIGSTDATNGQPFDQKQGFATVSSFPWIATQTAGNNVCVLTSATVRVNGTITYAGIP